MNPAAKPWTIWKYAVEMTDRFILRLPAGAEILCIQTQDGKPQMWARVCPEYPLVGRQFAIIGTGHAAPPPTGGRYIGTFQVHDGVFVWHLFEIGGYG